MFKAILFDFDGTLARTMDDHFHSWQRAFSEITNFSITPQDYYPLEGMSVPKVAEILCEKYGIQKSLIDILVEKKEKDYLKNLVGKNVDFYPGVIEVLTALSQKKILMAIVTGGLSDRIQKSVSSHTLKSFGSIVTADSVLRGKPFPDPYLLAAKELSIDPVLCIGVENAPLGVQSVKSAGMYCIGVASTVEKEKLTQADEVIGEFKDIFTTKAFEGIA